jgi:hypothetical protein
MIHHGGETRKTRLLPMMIAQWVCSEACSVSYAHSCPNRACLVARKLSLILIKGIMEPKDGT